MTSSFPVFSTAYFPPIDYLQQALRHREIFIDQYENYQKQTLRNRCFILSPNGVQMLSVPVQHTGGKKAIIKDIKIEYDQSWQQQHWRSLTTAYNRSAFFEFYSDELKSLFFKRELFLIDLNEKLFSWMIEKLKLSLIVKKTETFTGKESFQSLSDKRNADVNRYRIKPYPQVFNYKFGFVPNLSAIDLLFNKGIDANEWLAA